MKVMEDYSIILNVPYSVEVEKEQYEFVVWLIENGVDVENSDPAGNLILQAAATNNVLVVEYLLDNNLASINIQNTSGYIALMYASKNNCQQVVEYLLQNGASMELKNKHGQTALDIAIEYESTEVISIINEFSTKSD